MKIGNVYFGRFSIMWVLNKTRGKNFFFVQWEICSEINCGRTTFCAQQINIQALRTVKLKQAFGEPLSSTGGYRSLPV
jgi:hypothetical protein